jgi:hypothetical protein
MTADIRDRWARKRAQWAKENSAYLHGLLSERNPDYLTALRRAERRVDLEQARAARREP